MVWANVVNGLIGIWFIIAPFVLRFTDQPAAMWTSIIAGLILAVLAGAAVFNEQARKQTWIQYVNGLIGIWYIISPFVLGFSGQPAMLWIYLIGGVVVLVLAAWLAFSVLPKVAPTR